MGYIDTEIFSGVHVGDFSPVLLMGVVNLSPESFYKQSFIPKDQLIQNVTNFIQNGARIIDLGARSTAPGVRSITIPEEKQRLQDALQILQGHIPADIILSIDTQFAEIAEMAIRYAKENHLSIIINDVSSFHTDPALMQVVIKHQCPVIIMASNTVPGDTRSIHEILLALNRTIEALKKGGFDMKKLIIDPGVGKWVPEKSYEYDLAIIDYINDFRCFGFPILIGLSRKSFLGTVLNEKDASKREYGSLAATSIAVYNGAHIVRTHDINSAMVQAIRTAEVIRQKPLILSQENQKCEIIPPFKDTESAYFFLRQYGITPAGSRIMKSKMLTKIIVLYNITAPQGLILKQELLARGGDVGLHSQVITTEWKKRDEIFNVVLIGTLKQFQSLIGKLRGQQLKLDLIAKLIENALEQEKNAPLNYHIFKNTQ